MAYRFTRPSKAAEVSVLRLAAILFFTTVASQAVAVADEADLKRPFRSVRDVVYREVDGTKLTADVFRPANDKIAPVVLMIHGGAWSSGSKWHLHDHARELAQEGYVAVTINYRLAPLYQIDKQVSDCRASLEWLKTVNSDFNFDPKQVAVWGYSAGAHLACMLATQPQPDAPEIQAVVAGGAPCDFQYIPEQSPVLSLVMGGTRQEVPKVYEAMTPLNFVTSKCPPTLLYHGTADALVPYSTGRRMYEALKSQGVETDFVTVEGKGHLTTFLDSRARRETIEFLNKHLKPNP